MGLRLSNTFAEVATLQVNSAVADLDDVQAYLVTELVAEWRVIHDRNHKDSIRGSRRLHQYLVDEFGMSEATLSVSRVYRETIAYFKEVHWRNVLSWGMERLYD